MTTAAPQHRNTALPPHHHRTTTAQQHRTTTAPEGYRVERPVAERALGRGRVRLPDDVILLRVRLVVLAHLLLDAGGQVLR